MADFAYLRCWEGLLFFGFVIDVFSAGSWPATCAPISCSMRCGWRSRDARPGADVELFTTAMPSPIHQFRVQRVLDDHRVLGSVGSVGDV